MRHALLIFFASVLIGASRGQHIAPEIVGQKELSTGQSKPITIRLSDLSVQETTAGSSRSAAYPEGYTLEISNGPHYTFSGTTVTPAPAFTGLLTVIVRVRNANRTSPDYPLEINVIPNQPPVITGQVALATRINTPVQVKLSHLLIKDPDSEYPGDFSLKLFPGQNYTFSEHTVTPAAGFAGLLQVQINVNDGLAISERFSFEITVGDDQTENVQPAITGQEGIKVTQGSSLQIQLSHLVVEDPDNSYPEDFSISVSGNDNYTITSKNTITPDAGFLGTLIVPVVVHDGQTQSETFDLKVQVISKDRLEITGQDLLEVKEDSTIKIDPGALTVNDPSGTYPQGFKLQLQGGDNYTVKGNEISPRKNFFGNLEVPVTISRAGVTSPVSFLLVIVTPVNDPPELLHVETAPLAISGPGLWAVAPSAVVADVDDDFLLFAEIAFDADTYVRGVDKLHFETAGNIQGVFDAEAGVVFLVGRATKTEYENTIRSVSYDFLNPGDSILSTGSRKVSLKLNDGKETSIAYERVLMLDNDVLLEIPTAFTPNSDMANDTWRITPLKQADDIHTFIRVYDRKGNMVFESSGLDQEWDGHFNGDPLPADIYFYTIEMEYSYRKVNYKGIVSILR
jgi:gliding motility-associated-like protein